MLQWQSPFLEDRGMGLGAVYTASSVKTPRGYRAELIGAVACGAKVLSKEPLKVGRGVEASSCMCISSLYQVDG